MPSTYKALASIKNGNIIEGFLLYEDNAHTRVVSLQDTKDLIARGCNVDTLSLDNEGNLIPHIDKETAERLGRRKAKKASVGINNLRDYVNYDYVYTTDQLNIMKNVHSVVLGTLGVIVLGTGNEPMLMCGLYGYTGYMEKLRKIVASLKPSFPDIDRGATLRDGYMQLNIQYDAIEAITTYAEQQGIRIIWNMNAFNNMWDRFSFFMSKVAGGKLITHLATKAGFAMQIEDVKKKLAKHNQETLSKLTGFKGFSAGA